MRPTPGASNLTLSIGIVDAPISLYSTVNDREDKVTFCEIGPDGQRTKRPTVAGSSIVLDSKGEKVVAIKECDALQSSDIRKGFFLSEDEIVVLDQEEINALLPEKSSAVNITNIVAMNEIDPLMLNATYYVGVATKADEEHATGRYHLVSAMLGDSVGVGDIVLRNKHQAVAVYNRDGRLMLSTLHTANAINPAPVIEGEADADLVEAASALVDSLRGTFDPFAFKNEFKDAVLDLVHAKASGQVPVAAPKKAKAEASKEALLANLKAVQPSKPSAKKKTTV
jgi:DNA end-binding protein Ku